nr:BrnT family toxin [Mariprofundus ferrooxydans]
MTSDINGIIIIPMFDFDEQKSLLNLAKHGIDFIDARQLWNDPAILEVPARTTDEPRYLLIGKIAGKHWSCVVTYRNDRIRIISVRRSRKEEVALYES